MTGQAEPFGPFLERWTWPNGLEECVFRCPACGGYHRVVTAKPEDGYGAIYPLWTFNLNPDAPTFTPSVRVRSADETGDTCCHFYVTEGQIQYLSDCTHELAGKRIPMEVYP